MTSPEYEQGVNSDRASVPEADQVASGADAASEPGETPAPSAADTAVRVTEEVQDPEAVACTEGAPTKFERDLDELEAKAEKADEYLELARRTKADFENYRKRAAREAAAAQERGVSRLARELLPALDNLERALAASGVETPEGEPEGDGAVHTLTSGIKLVQSELAGALARVGIEAFSPEGEPFDPQRHEAMAQQPVPGAEPGTIVEVYQRGYTLGEAVLRPARVVVVG
jgi:molecular chaperone GrpE